MIHTFILHYVVLIIFTLGTFQSNLAADQGTVYAVRLPGASPIDEAVDLPICDDDHFMLYLAEIQAINPESIINLSTFDDLSYLCSTVLQSLDKMDDYLQTCQIPPHRDLYVQLIKGVDKLYDTLCTNSSTLKSNFQQHFLCLRDLHQDFEDCHGAPDWEEDQQTSIVCRSYKEIIDCYYIKAAKLCGKKSAAAMRELIKVVVDSIVEVPCQFGPEPLVRDAMPDAADRLSYDFCAHILVSIFLAVIS